MPDKFHVFRAIKHFISDLIFDEHDINTKELQNFIIEKLGDFDDDIEARKIINLLKNKPESLRANLNPDYQGCSQEG